MACPFCGTTNVVRAHVPMAEVRQAVRDVLYEDRNWGGIPDAFQRPPGPAQPPYVSARRAPGVPPGAIVIITAAAVVLSLFVTAVLLIGGRPKRTTQPIQVPPPTVSPTLAKSQPIVETWGQLSAITVDEQGNVIASIGPKLVKADGRSLTQIWAVARPENSGRNLFTTKGDWISVATDNDISFFDAKTGVASGTFRFKNGGILEGSCAVGKSDVIVYVLGDGTMRFNANTAKKSTGADTCKLQEEFRCGPGQTCGWERWTKGDLDCRYVLRAGNDVYRVCEADDGTKQTLIVRFDAQGKSKWRAPAEVRNFMGVVDGVLIASTDGARNVSAFELDTGKPKWVNKLKYQSPVVADQTRIYYGYESTLVVANSAGQEIARLAPPSKLPKAQ
ncbi:hypothetical protein AKJ09_02106 [Labilithrix luteola]|uniref:Uncharacterized protein n=1 Tax=Labilithrix luteola TaxID=1391654 RepID=A0A0K1PPJ7_9BACT|nr:hypothetical protein AKJ09_02106 [Labilithrix luteola]